MKETIFVLIIAILFFNLAIVLLLEYLNQKSSGNAIPELLVDVYDSDNYKKQQEYKKEHTKLSIIETLIGSILLITFFALGGFGYLQSVVASFINNQIIQALAFFGVIAFLSLIISLPFSYYSKFVIEDKYGFNKTTIKLFITDIIKSIALSVIIGGVLLYIITWIFLNHPTFFWIATLCLIIVLSILLNALYSTVILPLFNRKQPLEEGELNQRVVEFASRIGFSINNIYVIDGSKRSSKANAFFTGFGRKKRIFLYDTLIENLTVDEIVAVLAHELGHYKKGHIWINLTVGIIQSAIFLYLFNIISINPVFTQVMGISSDKSIFQLSILCFGILIEPIQFILGIFTNLLSRKMEFQADSFAFKHGMGEFLISSLKKLASKNYSNLTPNAIYVFINYSHPTLYDRILAIKQKLT